MGGTNTNGVVFMVVLAALFVRRRAWLAIVAALGCDRAPAPPAPAASVIAASSPSAPPAAAPTILSAPTAPAPTAPPELDALLRGVVPDGGIPIVAQTPGTPWNVTVEVPAVKMKEAGLEVNGMLAPDIVRRVLRGSFRGLRRCYEMALRRDPQLRGVTAVRFTVDAAGVVVSANPAGGFDAQMSGCFVGVVRALSFPEPGQVAVTYKLDFQKPD